MTEGAGLLEGTLLGERKRIAEEFEEIAKTIIEAFGPVFDAFKEQFATFMEQFRLLYEMLQRMQLEITLVRRWHIPYGLAHRLSGRWPRRWLPGLKPELWGWDEGETAR